VPPPPLTGVLLAPPAGSGRNTPPDAPSANILAHEKATIMFVVGINVVSFTMHKFLKLELGMDRA